MSNVYNAFRIILDLQKEDSPKEFIGEFKSKKEALDFCEKDAESYSVGACDPFLFRGENCVVGNYISILSDKKREDIQIFYTITEKLSYTLFKNDKIINHYDSVEDAINDLNKMVPSTKLHNALNILTEKENLENSPLYNDTKPILAFKGTDSKHHYDFRLDFYFLYKD